MAALPVVLYSDRRRSHSLGVGDGRVLSEGEVVVDVLIVGKPAVGPDESVGAHRHLGNKQDERL